LGRATAGAPEDWPVCLKREFSTHGALYVGKALCFRFSSSAGHLLVEACRWIALLPCISEEVDNAGRQRPQLALRASLKLLELLFSNLGNLKINVE
jgi:hypothetical protein